ncbi:hypothetical protein [Magnetospirillum sp. UT-4]|uniref:hypothetical protein n=1 Tax=Magnetospirillum sp. UT-4 TaxID=2681467 RepID=UPI00137E6656|nr:hypothetical protein [Magnetospirillum sp. UT-4]CAA7623623.1 exported hypothetical protein [Magnetospirillum sp. UT-4]
MRHLSIPALALALGFGFAAAGPAQASCDDADQCSPAECRTLQAHVHPSCDVPRSCANIAATQKAALQQMMQRNQACLDARTGVAACFSVQDAGHQKQINLVQAALDACTAKYNQ